jgi:hypothetical protein
LFSRSLSTAAKDPNASTGRRTRSAGLGYARGGRLTIFFGDPANSACLQVSLKVIKLFLKYFLSAIYMWIYSFFTLYNQEILSSRSLDRMTYLDVYIPNISGTFLRRI